MRIVVLDGYTLNPGDNPWSAVEALGQLTVYDRTAPQEIVQRAAEADIVLTNKTPLTAQTLEQLPRLKFISVLATGFNIVDVQAARARGVAVSNVPIYGTDSVAQYVFAALLSLIHNPVLHDQAIRAGQWQQCGDFSFWKTNLIELVGKTMGIVGFGRIGRSVGKLANAFGMKVIAHDQQPGDAPGYEPFAWKELEPLFAESDVVTLHCPQTADNARFVNAALLKQMKPTAYFINSARGGLVDEAAIAAALNQGVLAGAALDVVSVEPIREDNPLLQAKNCLLTPHMAWATVEARRRLMQITAENIAAFINGEPVNVVN